jgi:predicted  nucleic acid-binding Zn-ribbon protein
VDNLGSGLDEHSYGAVRKNGKSRAAERRDLQRDLLSAMRRLRKLEEKIERIRERLRVLSFEEDADGDEG